MPATETGANLQLNALQDVIGFVSAHTAAPGNSGANEASGGVYARQAYAFPEPAASEIDETDDVDIPIPGGVTVTHVGYWDAVSGGTMLYWIALASPQTQANDWVLRVSRTAIGF